MQSLIEYRKYINAEGLLIHLPEELFEEIKEIVFNKYPREFGGVFIGNINGSCAKIQQIIIPDEYKNGPTHFIRKTKFINKKLAEIYKQTEGNSYYLGDWHSHPDCLPEPSTTDFRSMKDIAEKGKVRIRTPLLLILGIDKYNNCNEQFYLFSDGKLKQYNSLNQSYEQDTKRSS